MPNDRGFSDGLNPGLPEGCTQAAVAQDNLPSLPLSYAISGGGSISEQMVTPERILQVVAGYQPLYVLASALDLCLFTHVAEGRDTAHALELATGASRRGLGMLLNTLVSLGLLARDGMSDTTHYRLTPESGMFLVAGRPSYLGGYVRFAAYRLTEQWRSLTQCVVTGSPVVVLDNPEVGTPFWNELIDLLFPWNYPLAAYLGQQLSQIYSNRALRLLDVAAGSGVWGIAAAQANPALRVRAFDLPSVLEHTRQNVIRFGLSEQFEFQAGDIRQDSFGEAEFDVAILGQICHSEGAEHSRHLFTKVARALTPGGTIVIIDMLPNEERSGPPFTLMYALTMLISTTEGNTFTFTEYDSWLQEAGFRDVRLLKALGQTLVLATCVR